MYHLSGTDGYQVPAIATEFLRNRNKHDSTAREWTRLYARPPPPPPPARGPAPSTPSTRAKGKARATVATQSNPSEAASHLSGAIIEIADSDEDHAPKTRTNLSGTRRATGKRKRGTVGNEAVDDDFVTQEGITRASTRRRTTGSSSSSTSSSRGSNDIIVIED
jgi:hypothetical protein